MGETTFQGILNPERQLALSGAALSNNATLTDISPAGLTLAAEAVPKGGQLFRFRAAGRLTTPGAAVPTLTLGIYWGGVAGVALAVSAAITPVISAAAWLWTLEADTIFRVPGPSGTFSAWTTGRLSLPASVSQFQAAYALPGTAPAAVTTGDTTVSRAVTVGAQWGSAVAGTTVQCDQWVVDSKN